MSPISPKGRCRVCHQLHCTDPTHKPPPWKGSRPAAERRPEYNTSHERRRRADVVRAWLREYGITLQNGDVIARCPECHTMRAHWVADHLVSVADGGSEDGELRVHCRICSGRQGARVAGKRNA